ncbi:peptide hydrolase [Trypanosoma cruzi]|nr:peptide hydrolase [Trypanosoma cruzi]
MLAWRRPGAAHLLRRTQAGRRGGNRRRNRDALTFGLGKRLRTVGKFDPCGAPCELPGASSTNFRDPSALAHRGDGPGVGGAARTDRCWKGAFERRPRQHRYERRASKHSALLPDGGVAQLLLGA